MRKMIERIVLAGGTVQFPYKRAIGGRFGEASITQCRVSPVQPIVNTVSWSYGAEWLNTLDEALDLFMKTVFTRSNLALAYLGISKRRLTNKRFDELHPLEIQALIDTYNSQFLDADYPDVVMADS